MSPIPFSHRNHDLEDGAFELQVAGALVLYIYMDEFRYEIVRLHYPANTEVCIAGKAANLFNISYLRFSVRTLFAEAIFIGNIQIMCIIFDGLVFRSLVNTNLCLYLR
jgi:hypothetical protein